MSCNNALRFSDWPARLSMMTGLLLLSMISVGLSTESEEKSARESSPSVDIDAVVSLLEFVLDADPNTARPCLEILTTRVQSREIRGQQLDQLKRSLKMPLAAAQQDQQHALHREVTLLVASWGEPRAVERVELWLLDRNHPEPQRQQALAALASGHGERLLKAASLLLKTPQHDPVLLASVIGALGALESPDVAPLILQSYAELPAELQPKAIELLTQRTAWSRTLLQAIGRGQLPRHVLNANQATQLLARGDKDLTALVQAQWGTVRTTRDPGREAVIAQVRATLQATPGDPTRGRAVFQKVCGQCHVIHGQGQQVGPELTRNGRGSFDQLLLSVLDPSLVIGAAYQARTVITADGRVLTGLLTEDSPQRITLKLQGGKQEVIARADVDEIQVSALSLMPEGLEKQIPAQELVDLFAFICLDLPPEDPAAVLIPGSPHFTAQP